MAKGRGVVTRYLHASRSHGILSTSWKSKIKALRKILKLPRSISRQAQFGKRFCAQGGGILREFALWSALVFENGDIDLPQRYAF